MATDDARRAVFLDRDGVLNRAVVKQGRPFPPASVDELEIIPGVGEACAALHEAGALLFCVTNQPDVARGTAQRQDVEAINEQLCREIGLDGIETCFHDDKDNCACRKPKPGMLLNLAARHAIDLSRSVMVGDRWRDIDAGTRAGCRTVFIDCGYDETQPAAAHFKAGSLAEALPWILSFLRTGKAQ